jgi:hypothetical protein
MIPAALFELRIAFEISVSQVHAGVDHVLIGFVVRVPNQVHRFRDVQLIRCNQLVNPFTKSLSRPSPLGLSNPLDEPLDFGGVMKIHCYVPQSPNGKPTSELIKVILQ